MTCWQAHLTGQINTDNLFADSTMLSQRWSTTKRWFPCRKALTLVLKWNACRNLLCVILSGFSNPQRLATPCVGNIEESCSCKMASCDVWIIWMMHWWGWWKETRIIQVAELWSAVISTYLQLFFVFLLLSFFFFFFSLKCSHFAPTHRFFSTGPVPYHPLSPGIWDFLSLFSRQSFSKNAQT